MNRCPGRVGRRPVPHADRAVPPDDRNSIHSWRQRVTNIRDYGTSPSPHSQNRSAKNLRQHVVVLGLAATVALVSAIAQGVPGGKADETISAVSTPPPTIAATFPPRLPAPAPAKPLPFEALQEPTESVDTPNEERPAPSSGSLTPPMPVPARVEFSFSHTVAAPNMGPPCTAAAPTDVAPARRPHADAGGPAGSSIKHSFS
jgi:hypothetical protein